MTTQERLDQVNAAINAIETGAQEYSVEGLRVKLPDLKTLYSQREILLQQLNEETTGGGIYVAVFADRR